MKRTSRNSPINAQPQPIAGRQLPADWNNGLHGRTSGQWSTQMIDSSALENAWKSPNWSSKLNSENVENGIQSARLSNWDDLLGEK